VLVVQFQQISVLPRHTESGMFEYVGCGGDYFRFSSVFIKKNNQTGFFKIKKSKSVQTNWFWFSYFEKKLVQTGLAWFLNLA
jgi:hypothetical protein